MMGSRPLKELPAEPSARRAEGWAASAAEEEGMESIVDRETRRAGRERRTSAQDISRRGPSDRWSSTDAPRAGLAGARERRQG
jgi:hypothetical protein